MTPGSPHLAWSATCRWQPLTSRTSATSPTTTACASLASTNADRRRHRPADGRTRALPVLAHEGSGHALVLRPRGARQQLAIALLSVLPSTLCTVRAPRNGDFAAQ